ncbi:MAG: SUMF1/EgtB/PvdO family nonheme iron enzyme [Prolixibacteraceae bacterium]
MQKKWIIILWVICTSMNAWSQAMQVGGHELVFVQGGWFIMGGKIDPLGYKHEDIFPAHKVYVDGFYIGVHEVTNRQYCDFLNKMKFPESEGIKRIYFKDKYCYIKYVNGEYVVIKGYENFPVNNVSWEAADEYCQYFGGRLPTEAEWEYAAKGGTKSKGFVYSGSNNIDEVGVTSGNVRSLCLVKSLKPNELGIYDMSGNVREFCSDWYDPDYYKKSPSKNPKGPKVPLVIITEIPCKAVRGGSFNFPYNLAIPEFRFGGTISSTRGGGHWAEGFRICFDNKSHEKERIH